MLQAKNLKMLSYEIYEHICDKINISPYKKIATTKLCKIPLYKK